MVELVVVRTLVRVAGGTTVVVAVRSRAVLEATGRCSVSDFLDAIIFGVSTCFANTERSIWQACSAWLATRETCSVTAAL